MLAFGAGGCLFWTDVVDTLPGSELVGWCLESVFFADTNTATIFYSAPAFNLGIDREGTAKSQDGQQKGSLAHVKRKVATALSMKVKKPVKNIHIDIHVHLLQFQPSRLASKILLHPHPYIFVLLQFLSLEAASKPALKPAARLILKDCLFCSKFAWSRTGVATEDANAFFQSCRKRAVLR